MRSKNLLGLSLLAVAAAVIVIVLLIQTTSSDIESESTPKSPLRVSVITWPGMGPGYLARVRGYFKELPVIFSTIDNTIARRAAFKSGKIDLHITTLDQYAIESAIGIEGKIIMLTEESAGADGLLASPSISSIDDLRGRRVAYAEGTPSHFLLMYLLAKHGLSIKDTIPIVVDDPGKAGEAFISKSVDSAVTWEPFLYQATTESDGKLLASTKDLPHLIVGAFVASEETLRQRPADINIFVNGWLKAVADIGDNPQATYPTMAEALTLPIDDFGDMIAGIELATREYQLEQLVQTNQAEVVFQEASRIWRQAGVIEIETPAETVFDQRLLRSIYGRRAE